MALWGSYLLCIFSFCMSVFRLATEAGSASLASMRRRSFFRLAGASAGVAALALAGCKKNEDTGTTLRDVGSGEVGALNLLYALEQVQTSFELSVQSGAYFGALSSKQAEFLLFIDTRLHDNLHTDILRTALGSNALGATATDFTNFSFADRLTLAGTGKTAVLNAFQQLKDLSVAAYSSVARYFTSFDNLTLIAKIASVEARHAALVRDILAASGDASVGQGFVGPDVVTASTTGAGARLEIALTPAAVIAQLNTYLATASQLTAPSLV